MQLAIDWTFMEVEDDEDYCWDELKSICYSMQIMGRTFEESMDLGNAIVSLPVPWSNPARASLLVSVYPNYQELMDNYMSAHQPQ